MKNILASFISFLLIISCSENTRNQMKSEMLPNAQGESDEVILVIDSSQWEASNLGRELKKTLIVPMLGLPQDEALFSINKISPLKLNSVFKTAKNIAFVMTLNSKTRESDMLQKLFTNQSLKQIRDDTTIFMRVQKDLFAKDQTVLFLFGATEELLTKHVKYNRSKIREIFEESSRANIAKKLFKTRETQLQKKIEAHHHVHLTIPYGWDLARDLKNFFWLRRLDTQTEQSIFVFYEPYHDASVFNNIDLFRDRITNRFLYDGEHKDIFIERQPQIPLFTERLNFNGRYAVESRGLWRINDMSRGGPFVSYTLVDEEAKLIYYLEGYVDSPGTPKKKFIKELETILLTFKTKSDLQAEFN